MTVFPSQQCASVEFDRVNDESVSDKSMKNLFPNFFVRLRDENLAGVRGEWALCSDFG